MFGKKLILSIAAAAVVLVGSQAVTTVSAKAKRTATFKVKIENIGSPDGLATADGQKYPFALSPGLFIVNHKKQYFFDEGKKADTALELQADFVAHGI